MGLYSFLELFQEEALEKLINEPMVKLPSSSNILVSDSASTGSYVYEIFTWKK